VGPITALAYVLTLESPERFAKSRDVGTYLGLEAFNNSYNSQLQRTATLAKQFKHPSMYFVSFGAPGGRQLKSFLLEVPFKDSR
jgi:hypothetical protein